MNDIYQEIIEQLKNGHRPHMGLDESTLEEVQTVLKEYSSIFEDPSHKERLKMALCILDHSRKPIRSLLAPIVKILSDPKMPPFFLITTLGVSKKHVIGPILMEGQQIPTAFLNALESLLDHKEPEVVEWVVRCLEELGPRAKPLYGKLDEIKPGLHKIFNPHCRNIREIIHLMRSRR